MSYKLSYFFNFTYNESKGGFIFLEDKKYQKNLLTSIPLRLPIAEDGNGAV